MSWAGHVVCTGFYWGNLRERDHWGDPDVDGRIILRWIFGKWEGVETGWSWLRCCIQGLVAAHGPPVVLPT